MGGIGPKLHLSMYPLSFTEWKNHWSMYLTGETVCTCRKTQLTRIQLDGIHK